MKREDEVFVTRLREHPGVDRSSLDVLFAALLLSSAGACVAGNILLLSREVMAFSIPATLAVLGLLSVMYAISRWSGSILCGAAGVMGMCLLLSWYRGPYMAASVCFAALLAVVDTARHLRLPKSEWLTVVLMAATAVGAAFSNFDAYNFFDNVALARLRLMHEDVLFHSAIASMIKNYGVVSTGLHGLVETPYHVLSHHLVALISLMSGQGVYEIYGAVTYVLLIPLLIFSVAYCAACLSTTASRRVGLCWAVACVLFVLPQAFLRPWLVWAWFLESESYLLSLALLLLSWPLLLKQRLSSVEIVLAIVVCALATYAKASTGLVFCGMWAARWLVIDRLRNIGAAVVFAGSVAVVAGLLFGVMASTEGNANFGVLRYVQDFSWQGDSLRQVMETVASGAAPHLFPLLMATLAVVTFFLFHFALSWLSLGYAIARRGLSVLWRSPVAVSIWASGGVGVLFVIFFVNYNPPNVYWFSHPAFLVALPAVSAVVAGASEYSRSWMAAALIAALVVVGVAGAKSYYRHSRWSTLRHANEANPLVGRLIDVRRGPLDVVWKIPDTEASNDVALLNGRPWLAAAPLAYPALSERAWVGVIKPIPKNGAPHISDLPYLGYGYPSYKLDPATDQPRVPVELPKGMTLQDWGKGAGAR